MVKEHQPNLLSFLSNFYIRTRPVSVSSRGGLEVEGPLRIQLKAGHYCLGGLNPAWGRLYGKNSDKKGIMDPL